MKTDKNNVINVYNKSINSKFFMAERPKSLKLCMQHQIIKYYRVCSNDDPRFPEVRFAPSCSLGI